MGATVAILPTTNAVTAAWERYVALVREQEAEPELLTDLLHQQAIVHAWADWRDLYLSWGSR